MLVNPLPAYGAGIQIHVEHLADYISGRPLRDVEARWNELFPAYEALGVSWPGPDWVVDAPAMAQGLWFTTSTLWPSGSSTKAP